MLWTFRRIESVLSAAGFRTLDRTACNVVVVPSPSLIIIIEAAYKAEIINIAEYLNTNYKEDQFVNIAKRHESAQPIMNSIIKTASKITEELSQPNEKSDAKQDGVQHTKARLGESLKEKWKNKLMYGQCVRNIDRQLISEEDTFLWLS